MSTRTSEHFRTIKTRWLYNHVAMCYRIVVISHVWSSRHFANYSHDYRFKKYFALRYYKEVTLDD